MAHTVGDVARIAHVSVRTLHHYDRIGLVRPTERSASGYRLYSEDELVTLRQVLFFKELGFRLDTIRDMVHSPSFDRRVALEMQRGLLAEKLGRTRAMIDTIDRELGALERGTEMTTDEMFEVFGDFDPSEHEDEARERWGETGAYQESSRRTARYRREDWERFKTESDAINGEIASLMDEGVPSADPRAMDAVERHRLQIDEWFYPCSHEMHAGLGEMYVSDPRFTATYEKMRPGMARYVRDAIAANAARAADGVQHRSGGHASRSE